MNVTKKTSRIVLALASGAFFSLSIPRALAQNDYPRLSKGVVKIVAVKNDDFRDTGTGLVIGVDKNVALVLTARHVIDDAASIEAVFYDKPYISFPARPFPKYVEELDIGVLVVDPGRERELPATFPMLTLKDVAKLVELENVAVIGHPVDDEWHVSMSSVARLNHEEDFRKLRFARSDVGPGNSGGPIFDERGRLLGIVTRVSPRHGIGVKINALMPILEEWRIVTNQLVPTQAVASLVVEAAPGAEIYLDDQHMGSVDDGGVLGVNSLEPGQHLLRAEKGDLPAWEEPFEVESGEQHTLRVDFEMPSREAARREKDTALSAASPGPASAEAYAILYKDAKFKGPSLHVRLADGGRINIRKGYKLHDAVASLELFAPPGVEIVLSEHPTFHKKYPGATARFVGNGERLRVSKEELHRRGLLRSVSSLMWLVAGRLPDDLTCEMPVK